MKRYKMDKWGQVPMVEPDEGNGPWSIRARFLILMPITVILVGAYELFQYLVKN